MDYPELSFWQAFLKYLLFVGIIDTLLYIPFRLLGKRTEFDKKTRWFLLHSACNMYTVYVIWDELVEGFTYPLTMYTSPTHHRGFMLVFNLHLYHMLRFKLTFQDWIHHVVFVFLGLTYSVIYQPYIVMSLPFLSLNGIPRCN